MIPIERDLVRSQLNCHIVDRPRISNLSASDRHQNVFVLELNACIDHFVHAAVVVDFSVKEKLHVSDGPLPGHRLVEEVEVPLEGARHNRPVDACPAAVQAAGGEDACFGGDVCDWFTGTCPLIEKMDPLTA